MGKPYPKGDTKILLTSSAAITGRERGTLVLENGRWHQFHHHGSIEDTELLAQYKAAVK